MPSPEDALEQFQSVLLELLERHPEGLSEYDLFNRLAELGFPDYHEDTRRDPLGLFRAHFSLFHALYVLRDRLWSSQQAQLDIGPLCIRRRPYEAQHSELPSRRDLLRDYYLDLSQLEKTSQFDLDRMLGRFWRRTTHNHARNLALEVLGLNDPVDDATIKQTYRRLAMRHHPDRGGNHAILQEINAAVARLLRD